MNCMINFLQIRVLIKKRQSVSSYFKLNNIKHLKKIYFKMKKKQFPFLQNYPM